MAVEGSGLIRRQIPEQVGFGGFLGSGRAVVRTQHKSIPAGNREEGKGRTYLSTVLDLSPYSWDFAAPQFRRTIVLAAWYSTLKPVRLRTA